MPYFLLDKYQQYYIVVGATFLNGNGVLTVLLEGGFPIISINGFVNNGNSPPPKKRKIMTELFMSLIRVKA